MSPQRVAALLGCLGLLAACTVAPPSASGSPVATPSPRATEIPTSTAIPTATSIPTATPIPTLAPEDASQLILLQDLQTGQVPEDSWSVMPAGGGPRTSIGAGPAAQWSPGGTRIYLQQAGSDCRTQIVSIRPDGSDRHVLPFDLRIGDGPFWWAPDGRHIAFLRYTDPQPCRPASAGLAWQVWVMDADGSHQHRLTSDGNGLPAWTSDGSQLVILHASDPNASWDSMQLVDLSGTVVASIDPTPGVTFDSPAFAPDGSALAYDRLDENGSSDVVVEAPTLSGTVTTIASSSSLVVRSPWSPDSRYLIVGVQVDETGQQELRVQGGSGTGIARVLTPSGADDQQAAWSPSGRSIVVARGGDQLLVLDFATASTEVTLGGGMDPQWQPIAAPSVDAP